MNIACGERISLNDLYAEITKLLEIDRPPIHGPERAGDIRDSLADISKAKELIGYEPEVTWQEGLIDTVEFFKQAHANQG